MESKPEAKLKPEHGETLLWCSFCDESFERPALLSAHLDRYNVNWKLYWQLFYSRGDGKACVLCNILHADRKSLECHFKMVHCITEPCAEREPKREPDVITIEDEPSEEGPSQANSKEILADDASPYRLCPSQSGNEQDSIPQTVGPENIDDIDVLFEINHAGATECKTSSITTPESLHLTLTSTSSEMEETPMSGGDVQALPPSAETLPSMRKPSMAKAAGGADVFIADGVQSTRVLSSSTAFPVLQPSDKVEELESHGFDLLSPCNPEEGGEAVPSAGPIDSKSSEEPDVVKIESDGAVIPVESSQESEISAADLPQAVSFPAEGRHIRPTAVVNPLGGRGERYSNVAAERHSDTTELPRSVDRSIPGPSRTATGRRPERNSPATSSRGCDLIAVVRDDVDCDTHSRVATPVVPCFGPERDRPVPECRTPPHALGDVERELGENWPSRLASSSSRDMPDLSRLTPSKIAAFMNKEVFSAKQQSDIEKHIEEKALAVSSPISKDLPATVCSDTSSIEWEADSEGSRMSVEDIASVCKDSRGSESYAVDPSHRPISGESSTERSLSSSEEGSLPFDFNIVSVESLPSNPAGSEQGREEQRAAREAAKVHRNKKNLHERRERGSSLDTKTRGKRMLGETPHFDAETPTSSGMNKKGGQHQLPPKKKSKTDDKSLGEMQLKSSGPKGVFKQPIGLCVGVIHPGSLVEVSTTNVPQTGKTRSSLDGMVMKVEETTTSIQYFIHFPNMDKRLDRWVPKEDIIQVYRTETEATEQAATQAVATSGASHLTKRRLAFELPPEAKRLKNAWTTDTLHEPPCASALVEPPGKQSHRPAIPIGRRAARKDRQPRDRLGSRIVSLAKARLLQSCQQTNASSGDQSQKAPGYRSATKTVARTGKAGQWRSNSSRLRSLRPRRAPVAASGSGASHACDNDAAIETDEPGAGRQRSRSMVPTAGDSDFSASSGRPVSAANTGGAQNGTGSSVSDGRAANQTDDERSKTVTPNNGSAKTEKSKPCWSRTEPPAGVTIRPVVDSMLDSLRRDMRVYVICTVLPDGWLRVYPAKIKRVLDRDRFYVGYLGFRSSHNEWISSELIHSIMDVEGISLTSSKLQTSWVVKSSEAMPRNQHEEASAASQTPETGREDSDKSSSGDPKHLKSVMNARESNGLPKGVSQITRKGTGLPERRSRIVPKPRHRGGTSQSSQTSVKRHHTPSPHLGAPPPLLPQELPIRLPQGALESESDTLPPSLLQETRAAPATRKSTAKSGHSELDFWTSVADVHNDRPARKVGAKSSPASFSSVAPYPLPVGHDCASPVPLASSATASHPDADRAGVATPERQLPSSKMGAGASAKSKGRGRPLQKLVTAPPTLQPSGSEAQRSGIDLPSVAKPRRGRPVKRLTVQVAASPTRPVGTEVPPVAERLHDLDKGWLSLQPIVSVAQMAGTNGPSVARQRSEQPKKKYRAASAAPRIADAPTQPTGKLVRYAVPSATHSSVGQIGTTGTAVSSIVHSNSRDQSDTAEQPVDSSPPPSNLVVKPQGSAAIPAAPHRKRGRPSKKFKAAKPPSESVVQSTSSALQITTPKAQSSDPVIPSSVSVTSAVSALAAFDKLFEQPPKKGASGPPENKAERATSDEVDENRQQRRSLRSVASAVTPNDTPAAAVPPISSSSAQTNQAPDQSAADRRDYASDGTTLHRKVGRPSKKFKAAKLPSERLEQSASSALQITAPKGQPSDPATPSDATTKDTPTSSVQTTRASPGRTSQAPAESAGDRRDRASDGTAPAPTDAITPCTMKEKRKLREGDLAYVIYQTKMDGTKVMYPTKIMQVNRDLYYTRFQIHYLGWAHRYDEWITEEVIYSIVDRGQPNFNVKALKVCVVSSPVIKEQLSRMRPCSVDLSVNNICFFSALRKGRRSVDDKRILALRAKDRD